LYNIPLLEDFLSFRDETIINDWYIYKFFEYKNSNLEYTNFFDDDDKNMYLASRAVNGSINEGEYKGYEGYEAIFSFYGRILSEKELYMYEKGYKEYLFTHKTPYEIKNI
jgi:hypothetical protein